MLEENEVSELFIASTCWFHSLSSAEREIGKYIAGEDHREVLTTTDGALSNNDTPTMKIGSKSNVLLPLPGDEQAKSNSKDSTTLVANPHERKNWGDDSYGSMQLDSVRSAHPQDGSEGGNGSGEAGWKNAHRPKVPYSDEHGSKVAEMSSKQCEREPGVETDLAVSPAPRGKTRDQKGRTDLKVKEKGRIAEV